MYSQAATMNLRSLIALLFLLFSSVAPFHSFSQTEGLRQIKTYYEEQAPDSCVIIFNGPALHIDQIVLIRHGKPDLAKKGWYNRTAAKKYMHDYDSVPVIPFKVMPLCEQTLALDTVFSSNIPRASSTANLMFGGQYEIYEDRRFREFERKIMNFINIKLPLGFWKSFSRGLWLVGLNDKGIESFKEAKQRSEGNADFLIEQAHSKHLVILVAHGFHNKYVMKNLKKTGWEVVRKGGKDYGPLMSW